MQDNPAYKESPYQKMIDLNFYNRNAVKVAKKLLGKSLNVRQPNGSIISATISETEAYRGFEDDACHAHKGKTPRCEVMYGPPGRAYVYFTYGMHYMLNLVTEDEGFPAAVLIRGVVVDEDFLDQFSANRYDKPYYDLTKQQKNALSNGPGKTTKGFGITRDTHNGLSLMEDEIWVDDMGVRVSDSDIKITPRIGIDYAVNSRNWPWRFILAPRLVLRQP